MSESFTIPAGQPPTLKSVDEGGRVIYVGSFSKSLFPALRLGYLVAPPKLVDTFRRIGSATVQGAPTHFQAIVARFIQEGQFAAHIRRMRKIYAERKDVLIDAASRHLDGMLTVKPTDTGFHTNARLAPNSMKSKWRSALQSAELW